MKKNVAPYHIRKRCVTTSSELEIDHTRFEESDGVNPWQEHKGLGDQLEVAPRDSRYGNHIHITNISQDSSDRLTGHYSHCLSYFSFSPPYNRSSQGPTTGAWFHDTQLGPRPMNIMAKSPNLVDSAYHGVYHRFWGVYTITIG